MGITGSGGSSAEVKGVFVKLVLAFVGLAFVLNMYTPILDLFASVNFTGPLATIITVIAQIVMSAAVILYMVDQIL